MPSSHEPFHVYVMKLSYFSGKFESYLRYKGIPYERHEADHDVLGMLFSQTGAMKVPAVRTSENMWLKDTTPMLQWFEAEYPETSVVPSSPALGFLAALLEDYADEWLWRPAMWWRWMPEVTRKALGIRVATEVLHKFPAPTWVLAPYFGWRQRRAWLWGDGMTKANSNQIRDIYTEQLDALEAILQRQPFLLGSHPSLADFGYMGPFFRHFGNDPDSAELMRWRGPAVYEWTARMWNTKASQLDATQAWCWPDGEDWAPIWKSVCLRYLPYLHQNALAWKAGRKRFDFQGEGLQFPKTVTTHYRVWCRQELQRRYTALEESEQQRVAALLTPWGGMDVLQQDGQIDAGLDHEFVLPFAPRPPFSPGTRLKAWAFGTARDTPVSKGGGSS